MQNKGDKILIFRLFPAKSYKKYVIIEHSGRELRSQKKITFANLMNFVPKEHRKSGNGFNLH